MQKTDKNFYLYPLNRRDRCKKTFSFCFAYISFLLLEGSTLPTAWANYPKKAQTIKTT